MWCRRYVFYYRYEQGNNGSQLFIIIKPLVNMVKVSQKLWRSEIKYCCLLKWKGFRHFRELYLNVCYMHLHFCSSSALRMADLGLRLRAKCLTGWGRGPVAATRAVLFKNWHSIGSILTLAHFFTIITEIVYSSAFYM